MNKAQKGEARAAARRWLRRARSERPKNLAALLFTLTLLASMFACAAADQQPALTIVESGLPAGTTQSSYQATLVAVGGLPPYAWKVQKGQLPNGLTLDSKSGIISGMPSKAGQWSVVVAVTDHFQPYPETDTANFGFNISSDNTTQPTNPAQSDPLSISSSTLPNGEVSQSYAQTVSATGGTSPYAWSVSSGKLPPGLSLSASGGISGTATTAGSYPFTLKVTDSSNPKQSATQPNTIVINSSSFDAYGGLVSMPSPNPSTGVFRTEKFGNKWMLVDPANNGLFMVGIYVLNGNSTNDSMGGNYNARVTAKYGDAGPHWATAQLQRLQSWGFNTVGPYASAYVTPIGTANIWSTPDHTNPIKFPFIGQLRPSFYGMSNLNQWAPQPVKNMLYGLTKYYTGYRPSTGEADYYDNNLNLYLQAELAQDPFATAVKASAHRQYLIGVSTDDSDQLYGFGNGPDFRTGYSNAHLGWMVLTLSPSQTANSSKGFVYSDTTVYSKKALHDALVAKYGTISALNAAWGSNYTTFDSSGTSATDAIGTGDGATLEFSPTLLSTTVAAFTLQISVNGQPVAGDQGDGTVWGPNVSGSVDYTTGQLSITFRSGYAPASGAALSAQYVQNGWGIGTGLMDEDARPSHQAWTGIDYTYFSDVNANVKSDLDDFLYQIADHYFSMCKSQIQSWMPGVMYLGPTSLGTWGAPSSRQVLQAAGKSVDVMIMGSGPDGPLTQQMLDFIYTYFGDKPFYMGEFRVANPDSAMFPYRATGQFATQAARGQNYSEDVTKYPNAAYTANGSRPYVGVFWWEYIDNVGQQSDWGLVSPSDNAYDGNEAVKGSGGVGVRSVPCSPPLNALSCGGEQRNYGDVISGVKSAHSQIMEGVQH